MMKTTRWWLFMSESNVPDSLPVTGESQEERKKRLGLDEDELRRRSLRRLGEGMFGTASPLLPES